jgi:hypothetical protein
LLSFAKCTHFKKKKTKDRKVKQVFYGGGYQWEGIRVNEDEYGGCILYSYMKIE